MKPTSEDEMTTLLEDLAIRAKTLTSRSTPALFSCSIRSSESSSTSSPSASLSGNATDPILSLTTPASSPSTPRAPRTLSSSNQEPKTPDRSFYSVTPSTSSTESDAFHSNTSSSSTPDTSYTSSSSLRNRSPSSSSYSDSPPHKETSFETADFVDHQASIGQCDNASPFGSALTDLHSTHLEPQDYLEYAEPVACLQCITLGLRCSKDHPTCTRCARRLLVNSAHDNFQPLDKSERDMEPCLAMRNRTYGEMLRGEHEDEDSVLAELAWEDREIREKKMSLRRMYSEDARAKLDKDNWVLPIPEEQNKKIGAVCKVGVAWIM